MDNVHWAFVWSAIIVTSSSSSPLAVRFKCWESLWHFLWCSSTFPHLSAPLQFQLHLRTVMIALAPTSIEHMMYHIALQKLNKFLVFSPKCAAPISIELPDCDDRDQVSSSIEHMSHITQKVARSWTLNLSGRCNPVYRNVRKEIDPNPTT